MKFEKIIIKKDFGNLLARDEVEFFTNSDSKISIHVLNRKKIVRFYGNENGKWGINNPCPIKNDVKFENGKLKFNNNTPFMFVEESMPSFTVMTFNKLPERPLHPTKNLYYADNTENWVEQNINKIIDDFKKIGVF